MTRYTLWSFEVVRGTRSNMPARENPRTVYRWTGDTCTTRALQTPVTSTSTIIRTQLDMERTVHFEGGTPYYISVHCKPFISGQPPSPLLPRSHVILLWVGNEASIHVWFGAVLYAGAGVVVWWYELVYKASKIGWRMTGQQRDGGLLTGASTFQRVLGCPRSKDRGVIWMG
ncbi:uncharacterized protein B0I36DRAFT_150888 [Microdochium trichocladiopsis]|uniref:Uncharacterized protein n=1 Tax=Microdochium trichocladiopsis TaxID=1682393 RepID=A0A9P8XZC9_9PEZI|nr:uncharacterized protein B0I36DRAFT_150888 [Microdochium trichocladiopsis]KAH7025908.1 hypothetical protein B0I36DRAFT_150888 [Microdochium trichocladiopsis]